MSVYQPIRTLFLCMFFWELTQYLSGFYSPDWGVPQNLRVHLQAFWGLATLSLGSSGDSAAKSLQSCLTLCDPIDGSPPGSPIPGILQARTMEWVAISFSNA